MYVSTYVAYVYICACIYVCIYECMFTSKQGVWAPPFGRRRFVIIIIIIRRLNAVGVQCPISSSLGVSQLLGLALVSWAFAVLGSIALPFTFHTWCFPFALICHWISIVFLLYGRRIATHLVDPSLTHFLGKFPGLGLALVLNVVVPEAEQRCTWSRKLDPNFCPGRGRTSASSGCVCCH